MQVQPLSTIPLLYQIVDPTDSTVYFVRAVIRDTATGTTLDTKNLVSQGSGRYTSSYLAPQDGQGFGRHIDITITVYTDSGYSVVSQNYERKVDKYLVRAQAVSFGGGNTDVNYDKIEKMVVASHAELLSLIKEALPADTSEKIVKKLSAKIDAISEQVAGIKPSLPHKTDLTPVLSAIEGIKSHITTEVANKEIPEPPETDLSPIISSVEKIGAKIDEVSQKFDFQEQKITETIQTTVKAATQEGVDKSKKIAEAAKALVDASLSNGPLSTPPEPVQPHEILSPYVKAK